jgi:hypothetical protein
MKWLSAAIDWVFNLRCPEAQIEQPREHYKPQRTLVLVHPADQGEPSAIIQQKHELYSAARYVEALRDALYDNDFTHQAEWGKHIHSLSPDDYQLFFAEVDELILAGALVHVLTPEQMEEVRANVRAKAEEYRALMLRPLPVDPALMHALMRGEEATQEDLEDFVDIDAEEVDVWAEDEEDAAVLAGVND